VKRFNSVGYGGWRGGRHVNCCANNVWGIYKKGICVLFSQVMIDSIERQAITKVPGILSKLLELPEKDVIVVSQESNSGAMGLIILT
jgi:putative AlgH/UPF0301 family transcriptional regulator